MHELCSGMVFSFAPDSYLRPSDRRSSRRNACPQAGSSIFQKEKIEMKTWVSSYFARTVHYSPPRFIVELTFMSFVAKFIIGALVGIVLLIVSPEYEFPIQETERDLLAGGWLMIMALIGAVVLAPIIETIIGQAIPIKIARRFTKSTFALVLISAVLFSALHIHPVLIASTFPVGIVLAWSFIRYRTISRGYAFWVTAAIHALHNAVTSLLILTA